MSNINQINQLRTINGEYLKNEFDTAQKTLREDWIE
jgi:hypothetical protein